MGAAFRVMFADALSDSLVSARRLGMWCTARCVFPDNVDCTGKRKVCNIRPGDRPPGLFKFVRFWNSKDLVEGGLHVHTELVFTLEVLGVPGVSWTLEKDLLRLATDPFDSVR